MTNAHIKVIHPKGQGFILVMTLLLLLILGVASTGLFNQIIISQRQANLSINHIIQLNQQQSLFNKAKQKAKQLVIDNSDLTVTSTGYTPLAEKDKHPISQWDQIKGTSSDSQHTIYYRLVHHGVVADEVGITTHIFIAEQQNPDWHQSSLPEYAIFVKQP